MLSGLGRGPRVAVSSTNFSESVFTERGKEEGNRGEGEGKRFCNSDPGSMSYTRSWSRITVWVGLNFPLPALN